MKKLLLLLTLIGSFVVNAQEMGTVSGLITDADGMPLSGATVSIKILDKGAMTDFDGRYTIENVQVGSYNVAVSYIGYETTTKSILVVSGQTTQVDASLKGSDTVLDEVILTANKQPQKITDVPATVNVIRAVDIQEFPSFNIGELAARQKGVDFVRSGVLGTGINIRGFNSAFNSKNLQVTDDRLSTLIATGLPLGSFSTITKDDIERVEILLGPNGTLYGPNAHNGLVSTITKDPRKSEGTTFAIGAGNQNVLTARLRHAQIIDDKFAYKFHFERSQGTEFDYVDSVYVGTTAYKELDLDRDFDSQKYGASLFYKPTKGSELIGYYGHSNSNNIGVTSAGRNQIKDWSIDVAQVKFVSKNFFANTYYTWSNTEDTYAINQRTQNYVSFINNGFSEQEARERSFSEQWFPTGPGTGIVLQRGALFKDDSRRFNAEGQYNNNWDAFFLTLGAQYQRDMADSKGTYLLDEGGIDLDQTGVYAQMEYKLEETGWGFLAGGRLDNHDLYGSNFIPKLAITKKVNNGTFRITYGKGIAVPSILNLKGKLFGGLVLGNGEGFTLTDGTKIPKLDVETINSYEIGYKGKLSDKLFIDTNAYYNRSDNFISPLVNVADAANGNNVTFVGDKPIGEVVEGSNGAFVLTYLNFGNVDTYGVDVGLNYYFDDSFRAVFNYSYFGRNLDKEDLANDGNLDGKVLESELPINTPNNKFSLGFHYNKGNFYGAIYGRYVQKYDFFSGINIAAETQDLDGDGVNEIVENARNGRTWNYGQLGGFTVDANAGYNFSDSLSLGVSITNLFNAEVREFVASPVISTLISFELKYNINFFKNKSVATN
ncbi:iron complex outermembrane receptor protein [Gelidibacter algens]|uniref:Iron complex outermembrane receptor protein n=1 Tax=Gelidibacter algens TaxID=49280 RepID=A0A1A7R6U4_9FLAO|nr:TonB-dependent receptor [Gelidibacter algens]OBX26472.1 TonB-dependent receptor [Gelidibacter algens]RAJ26712.1 iron complex outermembrane receptor protein [Gelidibacter algens]